MLFSFLVVSISPEKYGKHNISPLPLCFVNFFLGDLCAHRVDLLPRLDLLVGLLLLLLALLVECSDGTLELEQIAVAFFGLRIQLANGLGEFVQVVLR